MLREMGRRPTLHLNLPSGLRARRQRSGRVYYYYDTGTKPRREIPLGNDCALAVKRWAELEIGASKRHQEIVTFRCGTLSARGASYKSATNPAR
jgi:hypothetical protein